MTIIDTFAADIVNLVFHAHQARSWVRVLANVLHTCRSAIPDPDKPMVNGRPWGFRESDILLPVISRLLRFPPIKAVFTRTSLGPAFHRKDRLADGTTLTHMHKIITEEDTEEDAAKSAGETACMLMCVLKLTAS